MGQKNILQRSFFLFILFFGIISFGKPLEAQDNPLDYARASIVYIDMEGADSGGRRISFSVSRSAYFDGLSITIFEGSYQDRKRASHPAMLMGSEWGFRFRYPRAVERSGSGGGRPAGWSGEPSQTLRDGARAHRGTDHCRLARAFAVKPVAPQKAALPLRALGLDRSTRPKQRGRHAVNTAMRLAPQAQLEWRCRGRGSGPIRMADRRRRHRRFGVGQK